MPKPEAIKANRNAALAALIVSMAITLASQLYGFVVQPKTDWALLPVLLTSIFILLLHLKLLLPIPRGKHREALIVVLAGVILFVYANYFVLASPSWRQAPAILLSKLFDPYFWMLIGLLRRKSMARAAGTLSLLIGVFGLLMGIAALFGTGLQESSALPLFPVFFAMAAGYICQFILLRNWPVLVKPILDKTPLIEIEPSIETECY